MTQPAKNTAGENRKRLDEYRKTIPEGERACVWAEAGVVPYKLCDGLFDCQNCSFDMAMRGETLVASRLRSRGGKISSHCFYHRCHTWARVEEKANIRIGLDDFGQNLLGQLEKVSLPMKDDRLGKKSILVKARNSVYALSPPVDGYVVEVNEALLRQPELANKFPYEMGWMLLLRPTSLARNLKNLVYGSGAFHWFENELDRLRLLLAALCSTGAAEREVGVTLPDGGNLDFSVLDILPPAQANRILSQFFSLCS